MRSLDAAFAAHLATGATTLATCWRVTRQDGVTLGFTDHDVTISFDGTAFVPAHGLDGGERPYKLGPQVDTGEVVGILSSEAIAADDMLMGRYDGAMVETWRVNWRDPGVRDLRSRARIGEITREDGLFRAELRSGQQALNIARGRVYQPLCDATVGDARCGIDLDDPAFKAKATVIAVLDQHRVSIAGVAAFAEGWFGFGRVVWTSGRRTDLVDEVASHGRLGGVDIFSFAHPVGDWAAAGDGLTVTAGCDRRFSTCRRKFDNAVNFRGFPHIPGNDFVLRYPREGDALDGAPLVK